MNTKWRMVLAVVVALVVGAGAGAYGEHLHVKHSSTTKKTATATTTKAGHVPTNLFGAKAKTACPGLKAVSASQVAAYKAIYTKTAWKTTSAALVKQYGTTAKAYTALMPFATPAGKPTLRFLASYQTRLSTAAGKATSLASFLKLAKAERTPRAVRGTAVVAQATTTCAAA